MEEKKVCPEAAKLREGRQWAQESGSGSISLAGNQKGWILLSPSEGDECVGFSSHFLQRLRQLWSRKPRTASARRLACRVAFAEGWERVLGDVYGRSARLCASPFFLLRLLSAGSALPGLRRRPVFRPSPRGPRPLKEERRKAKAAGLQASLRALAWA